MTNKKVEKEAVSRTRVAASLLASLTLGGCACDSLWVYDTPRPSLKESDTFIVAPSCPNLVIDPGAIVDAQGRITITARRAEDGLGAESVPVDVRLGSCDEVASASPAAGAGGEAARDSGGVCEPRIPVCRGASERASERTSASIELGAIDQLGCRNRSASQLECNLDANGGAAFTVTARGNLSSAELVQVYVPVCVTPLEYGGSPADPERSSAARGCFHQTEVHVVPRPASAVAALAVTQLPGGDAPLPAGTAGDCGVLFECDVPTSRGEFHAGVVAPDAPQDAITESDFLPVTTDVPLVVDVAALTAIAGSDAPFLSKEPSCSVADGPSAALDLKVPKGQRSTAAFFLCAAGAGGEYRLNPASTSDTVAADGGTARSLLISRARSVKVPPLVRGYSAQTSGSQQTLFAEECDGTRERATSSAVRVAGRLTESPDSIVIQPCSTPAPPVVVPGDAAADATAPAAPADAGSCGPITLELRSGGTCTLRTN